MAVVSHRFLTEGRDLPPELEEARQRIEALARGHGLDFFDTRFVMCSYEEINMLAAYGGFPTRYPHWRFGMDYLQMQKSYEYGLSKIYEMVINTDPAYAYLMDCNLPVDQKLVMAHVYGHVDFFKHNAWFAHTDRRMLDRMADHAARVRAIMDAQGVDAVETFLEMCLSLETLIDPHAPHIQRRRADAPPPDAPRRLPASEYMDPHINPRDVLQAEQQRLDALRDTARGLPDGPVHDVLGFILERAPLAPWQHALMRIVWTEAHYFAPQAMTKIMNEGWATTWHTKMMTEDILTDAEVVDYADHNAGTLAVRPGQLNPYALGVRLWRWIRERWDKGRFGPDWLAEDDPVARDRWDTGAGLGHDKLFEVRATHNDVTFLDTFLDEDFVRHHGMFSTTFDPRSQRWVVDGDAFRDIKRRVLQAVASKGTPRLRVLDDNAHNRGELLLHHPHEGLDLDLAEADRVLANLATLWTRPVHLQTVLDEVPNTLTHDGTALTQTKGHDRGEAS